MRPLFIPNKTDPQPGEWSRPLDQPEQAWRDEIERHLADGEPRTFNRVCVELAGVTGVAAERTNLEGAFRWLIADRRLVALTERAPLFYVRVDRFAIARMHLED